MKKLFTLLALIVMTTINAQAPQGFNYQATVRNSSGALITNQNVLFKFNIMLNSQTSLPIYSETHQAPTDDLGQVNLVIGTGTPTTGTFSTINWGNGNYYLGIELNTGVGYVAMGTTQLLSVPYALYANSSGNSQSATPNLGAVLAVNNSANNTKIVNLQNPTDAQDAATKGYADATATQLQNQIVNLQSQIASLQNGNIAPVAPSNLSGIVSPETQINLTWTDNSTNEIGFKIERKTGSGSYSVVGTTSSEINSYVDNNLSPYTTYIYRVYSYNAAGNSLTYSNEITLSTTNTSVTDTDGNTYQLVTICNQLWTKSNLNVSKYTDGTPIPQVTDPTEWANLTTGAWCYYNNDPANGVIYGKLYNWYAVAGIYDTASATNPALRKKLAPNGFHIPTLSDLTTLYTCLGGQTLAGGKLKTTGTLQASTGLWNEPNTGATNTTGFNSLPSGERGSLTTNFYNINVTGSFWRAEEESTYWASVVQLSYISNSAQPSSRYKNYGNSVRCIRD
jgi:uncharacterized protein (TIGR02145 family)